MAMNVKVDVCSGCGQEVPYSWGFAVGSRITERVSNYWNKSLEVGIKEKLTERSRDHMRENEMHDMIAKFGVDVLKNHPLMKDGRIRRKNE